MVRDPAVNRAVREHHAGSSPALPALKSLALSPAAKTLLRRVPGVAGRAKFVVRGLATPDNAAAPLPPFCFGVASSAPHRRRYFASSYFSHSSFDDFANPLLTWKHCNVIDCHRRAQRYQHPTASHSQPHTSHVTPLHPSPQNDAHTLDSERVPVVVFRRRNASMPDGGERETSRPG